LAWRYRSDADFKDLLREHLQHILWSSPVGGLL